MACDLTLLSLTPYPPTSPGGFGYVGLAYATASASNVQWTVAGPVTRSQAYTRGNDGTGVLFNLPAGRYTYSLSLVEEPGCPALTGEFMLGEAPVPVDPSLAEAARWEPVGGVLPNPVLLLVEASLSDAAGVLRPGLHVQVELWQPAALVAFAAFKATLRAATQYVDAAPYLRAQLVALLRYPATARSPLVDRDASLRYYYRYRVADAAGAEPWQQRAGERYAVLAALQGPADTMAPYVADGTGRVACIFPSGEAVQFLGLPLEVSVLLPAADVDQIRYAELRYLDAGGQEVEIRSYALPASLPAGMLRIPLPGLPLPCAACVEVAIVDTDRAYAGTCSNYTPTPAQPGYLLTNTGRLRL
ncbi:hypothetical protein QMK33_19760 [Hymenobacter sp. H14-R3]|uniref:hypothetical protein n=1 Tax=Hymenobacter sp. H14-R3 TaxID=3046308 RepID=UPI0024BAAB15|nr:hypothetical protein [Hymenobacter sp. H14-R3]MDJ0367391.1 hypothetical protein [Hymenobacter sp. H14-R3]